MTRPLTLILTVVLLLAADDRNADKGDRSRLQGSWEVVSLITEGKGVPPRSIKGAQLIFKGDHYEMKGGEEEFRGTFKLDESKTPRHIDTTYVDTENKEKGRALGIYELKGNRLRIAWTQNKERPTTFTSKPGSGVRVILVKRSK